MHVRKTASMYYTTTGHINIGQIGANKKVDQWHFDSVAFVSVIIMSDIEDMKGFFIKLKIYVRKLKFYFPTIFNIFQ